MNYFGPRFQGMLLLALLASGSAWAHRAHRHTGVDIVIGLPLTSAWHYSDLRPFYAPPVIALPSPTIYIEQDSEQPAAGQQAHYRYYCQSAQGYYPYIRECPQGWQPVAPQPPDLR